MQSSVTDNPFEYAAPPKAVSPFRGDRVLHLLAIATTVCTFPLIFMGGLVTSHHAGMSVPDWPNSYGYNMFLFPPRLWIGGILYEHTHRLMATVVGMFSIALATWAWREPLLGLLKTVLEVGESSLSVATRRSGTPHPLSSLLRLNPEKLPPAGTRWLCFAVLGAVIFQGVLGGLRVVFVSLDLAIVHACVAQAFFCLAAFTALVTSKWWLQSNTDPQCRVDGRLVTLATTTVVAIYLQLIAGATMRHFDAGLAVPDLPLVYGKVLPPISTAALEQINAYRAWELGLDPVTLSQIWLHIAHRIGALLVSVLVVLLALRVLRRHRSQIVLVRPALISIGLLVAQVSLGVLTVLLRKPADVASAHVAVGALTLLTTFVLMARSWHLYRRLPCDESASQSDRIVASGETRPNDPDVLLIPA